MTSASEAVGQRYRSASYANDYDKHRFGGLQGRILHKLECRAILRAFAALPKGAHVADVPCGTGRLAEALLARGLNVTGMDISPAMLDIARGRLQRFGEAFTPVVAELEKISSEGPQFAGVLCARFLFHFPLAEQVERLKQVAAMSRGPVVFTHGLDSPVQRLRYWLTAPIRSMSPTPHALTRKQVRQLIADAGLQEVRSYRILPLLSASAVFIAERLSTDDSAL